MTESSMNGFTGFGLRCVVTKILLEKVFDHLTKLYE